MEVFLKLKKALEDLNDRTPEEPIPPLAQPPKAPNVNSNDIYNRNENPWQDNPHHGNFPPGFMFGRDRRGGPGGIFSEIDKEFEELDRFMQNSRQIFDEIDQTRMGFGQMFKELSDLEQNSKLDSICTLAKVYRKDSCSSGIYGALGPTLYRTEWLRSVYPGCSS